MKSIEEVKYRSAIKNKLILTISDEEDNNNIMTERNARKPQKHSRDIFLPARNTQDITNRERTNNKASSGVALMDHTRGLPGNEGKWPEPPYKNLISVEFRYRQSDEPYLQGVNGDIFVATPDHPPSGSAEYFQAAENYALYGNESLVFPQKVAHFGYTHSAAAAFDPGLYIGTSKNGTGGNGNNLHSTLTTNADMSRQESKYFPNFNMQSADASVSTNFPMRSDTHPVQRPAGVCTTAANNKSRSYLGNRSSFVPGVPLTYPPPRIYNQQSSTGANIVCNMASSGFASSPAIGCSYAFPCNTTQQHCNVISNDNQHLGSATAHAAAATGFYDYFASDQNMQHRIFRNQNASAVSGMVHYGHPPQMTVDRTPTFFGNDGSTSTTKVSLPVEEPQQSVYFRQADRRLKPHLTFE